LKEQGKNRRGPQTIKNSGLMLDTNKKCVYSVFEKHCKRDTTVQNDDVAKFTYICKALSPVNLKRLLAVAAALKFTEAKAGKRSLEGCSPVCVKRKKYNRLGY
jgi:hypothetical protein